MTEYFKDVDHDEAKRRLNNYYVRMQRCDDYTRFKNEQSTYSKNVAGVLCSFLSGETK